MNPESRAEYDEYLSSHLKIAGYQRRFNKEESESDSEEEEYAKKRTEDRAKRRFEERDDFFNDAFMKNFRERRSTNGQTNESSSADQVFDQKGKDIKIEVSLSFHEAIKGAGERDVVALLGKGHEDYQIVGRDKLPFSDRGEAEGALRKWRAR